MEAGWKQGEGATGSPVVRMREIDPSNTAYSEMYKLIVGTVVPRPIAFVSTVSAAGITNLAPFSFFNGVCSKPPTILFSVARKADGGKKDTLRNIEENGEFVVNSSSLWLTEPLVHSAGDFAPEESEFYLTGLTAIPSVKIRAPRVKEAAVHFECRMSQLVEVGDGSAGSATVVFGEIVYAHVMEEAFDEKGYIHSATLEPLGRLGGFQYSSLGEVFSRKPPVIQKSGS